jgi:hypothetical protein
MEGLGGYSDGHDSHRRKRLRNIGCIRFIGRREETFDLFEASPGRPSNINFTFVKAERWLDNDANSVAATPRVEVVGLPPERILDDPFPHAKAH